MKYYLIAGEASGDLHASNLMKGLKKLDGDAQFICWGGDKMQEAGGTLVEHYRNTAFMGFIEVVKNLRTIFAYIRKCKASILREKPDVLILIDYPGFNLRIAKWAASQKIKIVYYITPQVWAWHQSRVHALAKFTDLLLVILPFESAFFNKFGYRAFYVGHPLTDAIHQYKPDAQFTNLYKNKDVIALLPGSRKQEIALILPRMLEALKSSDQDILLAGAPAIPDHLYLDILEQHGMKNKVTLVRDKTYDILSIASSALVGSGTATLETALFKVPQVVCYKGHFISYQIAKRLVNIPYISLVNLIAEKEVVKELIQDQLTTENIQQELKTLALRRSEIIADYEALTQLLGNAGASDKAAGQIYQLLQES
ncbi:MAG: lipid-A-disaccharide synthase [Chitinophagales bacterium]|nr:lipid-A-disaccharide synthase [Chitinophagales bacterium]